MDQHYAALVQGAVQEGQGRGQERAEVLVELVLGEKYAERQVQVLESLGIVVGHFSCTVQDTVDPDSLRQLLKISRIPLSAHIQPRQHKGRMRSHMAVKDLPGYVLHAHCTGLHVALDSAAGACADGFDGRGGVLVFGTFDF